MAPLIAHALLALAILALCAAGLRASAALGAAGLQRVLATLPIAATAAALGALALGAVDRHRPYAQDIRERELATARCLSDLEPAYSDQQYSVHGPGEPG